ncbi:hypothetical protein Acr_00g0082000 [Actinidia rufa]|uniref:Uncharacterized protein n=1 Tax=Actinidia rufa TaxID=165716 RepID=A0A7J0DUG1_9ERIC|nr:hypothetical protein Acr_00g0082000 [Actinidia rufa]
MELNRAQLLVHDDEDLNKFRTDHGIPMDVQIEHPGPNKDSNLVLMLKKVMARCHLTFMQVSVNFIRTMLMVDTLMHQMKLSFSAEDLLHVYTMVRPKREPRTPFLKGNHYLCLKNSRQTQIRLVTNNLDKGLFLDEFVWVLGNWEFQARDDGLWLFPRYNGHLLDRLRSSVGSVFLPYASRVGLRNTTPSTRRDSSDSKEEEGEEVVSQLLVGKVEIAHSFKEANDSDASSGETNMVSFKTLDQKKSTPVVDPPTITGPPISQVHLPTIDPILAMADAVMGFGPSSLEALLLDKRKGKELTVDSYKRSKKKVRETRSILLLSSSADVELWKPEFSAFELGKQESSKTIRGLLLMQQVQPLKSYNHLGSHEGAVNRAEDDQEEVTELRPRIFMEGWLACLTELGIPEDNLPWAKTAPATEFPEPPEPYSPMILPDINEEEYMNQLAEDKDVADAIVASGNEFGGGEKEGVGDVEGGLVK